MRSCSVRCFDSGLIALCQIGTSIVWLVGRIDSAGGGGVFCSSINFIRGELVEKWLEECCFVC